MKIMLCAPSSPLTATLTRICDVTHFICLHIKSSLCIEYATVLWTDQCKSGTGDLVLLATHCG